MLMRKYELNKNSTSRKEDADREKA
jgi:hypothetical protein